MPKEMIHEKGNLLDILQRTRKAVKEKDALLLKDLSNRTIHSASINQDTDSITIAVILYTLYKAFIRPDYEAKYKDWGSFVSLIDQNLQKAVNNLEKDKTKEFRDNLLAIRKIADRLSGNFKKYIEEVFRRALISKASRIYEHGISMEQTAYLLGVTVFELAEYAGKTGISDVNLSITTDIDKRLQKAEELFGK